MAGTGTWGQVKKFKHVQGNRGQGRSSSEQIGTGLWSQGKWGCPQVNKLDQIHTCVVTWGKTERHARLTTLPSRNFVGDGNKHIYIVCGDNTTILRDRYII